MTDEILRLSDVTKVFGRGDTAVRAVDGVSFTVAAGELLLIMGPSGSGKTTLLTIIGGLLRPTSGSVTLNGAEITTLSESQLVPVRRKSVGFVFQSFNLWESLTARENVEPPLLLADEPTANLDSANGLEIMGLLREIARSGGPSAGAGAGRAVIAVSHDQRIREVADRVLWLEDGRIRDIGHLVRDPVCGMGVEVGRAVAVVHDGRTFHFCSQGCSWEFRASPERFLAGAEEGRS